MRSWKIRLAVLSLFGLGLWASAPCAARTHKSHSRSDSARAATERPVAKAPPGAPLVSSRNEVSVGAFVDCTADPICKQLTVRANELSRANQHEQALNAYEGAYALHPSPYLLMNIGRLQYKLGRIEDALLALRKALAQTPEEDLDKRRRIARFLDAAENAAASLARANPPLPSPPPPPPPIPLHKRWQLWTGIGVPLALGAAAVAVGVTVHPFNPGNSQQIFLLSTALTIRLP